MSSFLVGNLKMEAKTLNTAIRAVIKERKQQRTLRKKVFRQLKSTTKRIKPVFVGRTAGHKTARRKTLKKTPPKPSSSDDALCSVCLNPFDETAHCCELNCGHKFHTSCIFTWFKNTNNCPMCRTDVSELVREENGPNIVFPPYSFLEIVLDITDQQLRANPPPARFGEQTRRMYAMAAISTLDSVINGMSREEYSIYCDRANQEAPANA